MRNNVDGVSGRSLVPAFNSFGANPCPCPEPVGGGIKLPTREPSSCRPGVPYGSPYTPFTGCCGISNRCCCCPLPSDLYRSEELDVELFPSRRELRDGRGVFALSLRPLAVVGLCCILCGTADISGTLFSSMSGTLPLISDLALFCVTPFRHTPPPPGSAVCGRAIFLGRSCVPISLDCCKGLRRQVNDVRREKNRVKNFV